MPQLDLFIFTSQIFTTTILFWFSYILFSRRQLLRMSFILKYRKRKNLHMLRIIDILAFNYFQRRIRQTESTFPQLCEVLFTSRLDRMLINFKLNNVTLYESIDFVYKFEQLNSLYPVSKHIIEEERLNIL